MTVHRVNLSATLEYHSKTGVFTVESASLSYDERSMTHAAEMALLKAERTITARVKGMFK